MKNVVVDFSHLAAFCGFGDICRNFAPRLAEYDSKDMHFIFVVPKDKIGCFGNKVDYISKENPLKDIKKLGLHVDLWHATDQLFKYRLKDKNTIQLLTIHDLNFLHEKVHIHRWKHIYLLKRKMDKSNYLTFISNYARQEMEDTYNNVNIPYQVIYNGIQNLDHIKAVKPDFVKDENEKFFFTIGQIRKKKNFHTLVPMMKYFPDYHLYICGDDHFDYSKQIDQCINDLGTNQAMLTGKISQENKVWLYQHCAAFLFPSTLEGFGIPVLEAMQQGCKIVSSNLTSLPEVCDEYASYWDHFDTEYMAEVVQTSLDQNDPKRIEKQISYARNFNYDRYTESYISLYKKLLNIG